MAKQYPLVCCDFCGKDTRNKSRICSACTRGISMHAMSSESVQDSRGVDRDSFLDTATHDGEDPMDRSEWQLNYDGVAVWPDGEN